MDEVYRDYRISISDNEIGGWSARITHVRGTVAPLSAGANGTETAEVCLERARCEIDRYLEFLAQPGLAGGDDAEA